MTLDDYDLMEPTTAATGTGATKRCRRHEWVLTETAAPDSRVLEWVSMCRRCGKPRDEVIFKRNRRNRQRGSSFERTVAQKLGGRRTGPLGGRDDVMVGDLFVAQTKRAQRFSLTEARVYLGDLRRTYPTRTPIVVHALPGERGGVVIVAFGDWLALHGPDGTEDAA